MIDEVCFNLRSGSAGHLQPASLSQCEVTFTGLLSRAGGHEVNNPLLNHRPDNKMVAVDLFISRWSSLDAATLLATVRGDRNKQWKC